MNAQHQLGRLIQSVQDGNGWTDRQLARRIDDAGMKMSHSHIGNLKHKPIKSVNASMVRTLAAGLKLPESEVVAAALASMGVHVTRDSTGLDVAIADEPSLSDYDKRLLRAVVKEMRHAADEQQDQPVTSADAPTVADQSLPDGATTPEDDEDPWALAANRGPSVGKELKRQANALGEESQDPGHDEPA